MRHGLDTGRWQVERRRRGTHLCETGHRKSERASSALATGLGLQFSCGRRAVELIRFSTMGRSDIKNVDSIGVRLIPASAGSTTVDHLSNESHCDHPRDRGEHTQRISLACMRGGSSPRARGARPPTGGGVSDVGIIPTSAGSTQPKGTLHVHDQDHPSERGEHDWISLNSIPFAGSSPRARGAHGLGELLSGHGRIIPASAGSTGRRSSPSPGPRDHPRERGEHPDVEGESHDESGSSARARGAHLGDMTIGRVDRIIPASAGSTHLPRRPCCW